MLEPLFVCDPAPDDDDARQFLAALNARAVAQPLPVEPDDILVAWWGYGLYIAVEIPALKHFNDFHWIATDLELYFTPQTSHRGRAIDGNWGDSGRPLDDQLALSDGQLVIRDVLMTTSDFAAYGLRWLSEQLARPLQRHGWTNSSASRIVLHDSGDVIAERGRLWRRRSPDLSEPLRSPGIPVEWTGRADT